MNLFKLIPKIVGLLVTHIFFGRLISVPYSIFIFTRWYVGLALLFLLDLLQIPLYSYIYERTTGKFIAARIRLWHWKLRQRKRALKKQVIFQKERVFRAQLIRRVQKMGTVGVFLISLVPFGGGGMWSGIILSHLLRLKKAQSYFLLASGSLVGSLILALGWSGIRSLIF